MTDEEYTQDLARRIRPTIEEFHGEMTAIALEHIIGEALFVAGQDIRSGRLARLEYIGAICRKGGRVMYSAHDDLDQPIADGGEVAA